MTTPLPTFVINLPRSQARRRFMEAQLELFPELAPRFFPAVDGRTLEEAELQRLYDEPGARQEWGWPLSRPQVGCALSHIGVYETMVREAMPLALVLEDDALLSGLLPEALAALAARNHDSRPAITLLSPVKSYPRRKAQPLTPRHTLATLDRGAWLATAYLINLPAANILSEQFLPVRAPADCWNRTIRHRWAEVRAVIPCCASITVDGWRHSTIHEETLDNTPATYQGGWFARWRYRLNLGDRLRQLLGIEVKVPRTW